MPRDSEKNENKNCSQLRMKIISTISKSDKKWKVSCGHTPSFRKSATYSYKLVLRRFLRTGVKEKISILVKYGKGSSNETIASLDARYLLYTLACFLEGYLNEEYLSQKYKEYSQK